MAKSFETRDYVFVSRGRNVVKVKKEKVSIEDIRDLEFNQENFDYIQETLMKLMETTGYMLTEIDNLRYRNDLLESQYEAVVAALKKS